MSISPSSISVIDFFKVTVPCSVLNSNFNLSLKNLSTACHMNLKGCTLQSLTASRTASCSFIAPGSFRASIPQLCYKNTQIQKCSHERLFFQKCSQTQQLGSFDCHQEAQNSGLTYPFLVLCQRPKQASSSKDLLGKVNGLLLFCFQKVQEKVQDRTSHKGPFQHFRRRKATDSGKLDMCSKSPLSEEHLGQMHLIPRFRYDTHRVVGICRSCLNLKWTFNKTLDFRTKCLLLSFTKNSAQSLLHQGWTIVQQDCWTFPRIKGLAFAKFKNGCGRGYISCVSETFSLKSHFNFIKLFCLVSWGRCPWFP